MDNLTGALDALLNNPESLERIKELAGQFGLGGDAKGEEKSENGPDKSAFSPEAMQMLMKLMPLMSSAKQDDNGTRLLHALRPLLSENKRPKVDESLKILQIMRVLPLLRNQDIF